MSDPIAVSDIKDHQASAVASWNGLHTSQKTFAKWKELFVDGMMANHTTILRVAPSGDSEALGIPPPPTP